jgi:leucyl-tRNA synthetase
MKLMTPFTPHLANECLNYIKCKQMINGLQLIKNILEEIKIGVQINGKTRDILNLKKDLVEKEINKIIIKKSKAKKYIENSKDIKNYIY